MNWLSIFLNWYVPLFLLGLIAYPIARVLFASFPDRGYAFGKIIAFIVVAYLSFVLGDLHLFPFTQIHILIIAVILCIFSSIFYFRSRRKKGKTNLQFIILMVFEELMFLCSLVFWTYIRSQEPSIHSLEKFMDFGFINSILRAKYFPPLDIWYAGYPINYYYFGHLMGATLIKLTGTEPDIGYNLILATLFGLGITETFSFVFAIVYNSMSYIKKKIIGAFKVVKIACIGLLGSFILNLGGNLHTIYLFTKGYPADHPIPFWQILGPYNPTQYWYPNATRFIPYTIHEFPSYSYVVADLHGHVFDIPIVLLTLAILFVFFATWYSHIVNAKVKKTAASLLKNKAFVYQIILLGFLTAIHYMTNAIDGPIYILLIAILLFPILSYSWQWLISMALLASSFLVFSLPFSHFFSPFAEGIGVNCSPRFLTDIGKIGPFLFEKGNCQTSPFWMLFVLWGFFWTSYILFILSHIVSREKIYTASQEPKQNAIDLFILILFSFSTVLIIIPEFFYIKDIYPLHFRANTMFKLGYQAFMMMSIASAYTFYRIKLLDWKKSFAMSVIFLFFFALVAVYPLFSIPSYYGSLTQPGNLSGMQWLNIDYPQDKEIIDYLNTYIKGQPIILEAQGDSYTDYERISAMTGLPTVAGWWVHEWLWRGSSDVIAKRIPDIVTLYESPNLYLTEKLIKKYHIKYVIVSQLERKKYPRIDEDKFTEIGKVVFKSSNGLGTVYQVSL